MGYVAGLATSTVVIGAMNNVTSKMRSVTFGPFNYVVVLMNSGIYLAVYATILTIRRRMGIVHKSELNMFWKSGQLEERPPSVEDPLIGRSKDHRKVKKTFSILDSPWMMVIIAGCMDASGNLIGFIAQAHLPQVLYQLFLQNLVLFSVIISMILLGRRYSVYHVTGLTLTVISGLIGVAPDLKQGCDFRWGLLATLSTLPTAISYVAKERLFNIYDEKHAHHSLQLNHKGLDVFIVNTHVAIVQLLVTPLLSPLNVLVGETNGASLNTYLHDGYQCLFHGIKPLHSYNETSLQCDYAMYTYLLYIACNLCFNISLVALTKYGTSVQTWMVVRLLLPVTLVLLLWKGWPFLTPLDAGINSYVIGGAILAFLGATIFRYSTIYIDSIKDKYNITGEITCLWPLRI